MTLLKILKYPNISLKKKSENINIINTDIKTLALNMIETMLFHKGIGLAANQVNIQKNIIVLNINNYTKQIIIINPKIINKKDFLFDIEGCLSFPDIFIKVKRNKNIKLKFIDINGKKITLKANNLLSICIQHEIDHLNGITLYDKMSNLKKKMLEKYLK